MDCCLDLGWCFGVVHRHSIVCMYLDRELTCSVVWFAAFAAWLAEARRGEVEVRTGLWGRKVVMTVVVVEQMVREGR